MAVQPRNNIAALDVGTGLATRWNPNADAAVRALALNGTTIYAGGDFSMINNNDMRSFAIVPMDSSS